jgi:hypothetical protein
VELDWDGRDGSGGAMASGVYLARVEAAGKATLTPLIPIRRHPQRSAGASMSSSLQE